MQALLEHFITQSVMYSLIAVALVAFLESLALVGLILPGTVMMAGLGALIGSGEVNFWQALLAGIIGCLLGQVCNQPPAAASIACGLQNGVLKKRRGLVDAALLAAHPCRWRLASSSRCQLFAVHGFPPTCRSAPLRLLIPASRLPPTS